MTDNLKIQNVNHTLITIAACKFIVPIHDYFFLFHTTAFQKYLWGSAIPRPKFFRRQYLGHLFYFTFCVHSLLYVFMNLENVLLAYMKYQGVLLTYY